MFDIYTQCWEPQLLLFLAGQWTLRMSQLLEKSVKLKLVPNMPCHTVIHVCINLTHHVVLVWWCQLMASSLLMLFWQERVLLVLGIYKDRQNTHFCTFLICHFYHVSVMLLCYYFSAAKFSLLQKVFPTIFTYVRTGVWSITRNIVPMTPVLIPHTDTILFSRYRWYRYKKTFFSMDVLVWLSICPVHERSRLPWINQ